MKISEIDKNFAPESAKDADLVFLSVEKEPFSLYGVFREGENLVRMPDSVAKEVSSAVHLLSKHTAGGRVRFSTDSRTIAVSAVHGPTGRMDHMAYTGSHGLDLYVETDGEEVYFGTFRPDAKGGYGCSVLRFADSRMRNITVNLPLYSELSELYIGLERGAELSSGRPYSVADPVVYYGTSVTQGGCASRPGMSYEAILSRRLDVDHVNLGFSGSGRGERRIAEYIATLRMSALIIDYDYNSPSAEELAATHPVFLEVVRSAQPTLPVIVISRPRLIRNADELRRRDIIRSVVDDAVAAGDKNIYFIDGGEMMKSIGNEGTVDGTHPTDLGFYAMAGYIEPTLRRALGIEI
ncbi:MAG: SGNH/GDSL hydrolase family protein [Clostridia bacterium]|nr:SGNH/GDSL hydrolase family protein [Clostridia bacterium]